MNTLPSAVSVFERVEVPEEEKFYISPEMRSAERQQRIKIISDRLERRKRTILISSQGEKDNIVFGFDVVFRDLAPIYLMKREIIKIQVADHKSMYLQCMMMTVKTILQIEFMVTH
jgi:hypothetical protein